MSYQVLALKWRPQLFDDVIGQETVTRTLKNAIRRGRIANAFLFSGVRGVGKTTTARILAKALNCSASSAPVVDPCGECASCKEIAASRSLDVLEIDGASHTKVDEIREVLEASQYSPSRDRFKIYIIDEVHMLSLHSFNALLKTLEEPPPHLKFIFATTEYHKIPDTIVSRCQQFEFRTVSSREIAGQLRRIAEAEHIEITDGAVRQISRAADGSIRDALSALDQIVAASASKIDESDVAELLGLIATDVLKRAARAVVERDTAEILLVVDELVRGGRDLQSFARGLVQFFRDVLVCRVAPDAGELMEMAIAREEMETFSDQLSEEDLIRGLEILTELENGLRWSPEPRFHLEVALLKLAELRRLASFEDLLARFERLDLPRPAAPAKNGPAGGGAAVETKASPPSSRRARQKGTSGSKDHPVGPAPTASSRAREMPTAPAVEPGGIMERLLERLRSAKPKVAALASQHAGVRLEGDCLHLSFVLDQPFLRQQVQQEELRGLLEREASEVAGRPLRVEIAVSRPERQPKDPAEAEVSQARKELYQRALSDPMVQGFVETFKGEVEDVRPPREASSGGSKARGE